jgi:hypothetical protein
MFKSCKTVQTLAFVSILIGNIAYADPTFHLKNNSSTSIQIDIIQGLSSVTGLKRVARGGEFAFPVDIILPTRLIIYYCPTASFCKEYLPEKYTVDFKAGQTMYTKFDGTTLTPQKGNMITGKTTAGYPLNNNITLPNMWITHGARKALRTGTKESVAEELKKHPEKSSQEQQHASTPGNKDRLLLLVTNPPQFLDNFGFELQQMLNQSYNKITLIAIKKRINQENLTQIGPTQKEWKKNIITIIDQEVKTMR